MSHDTLEDFFHVDSKVFRKFMHMMINGWLRVQCFLVRVKSRYQLCFYELRWVIKRKKTCIIYILTIVTKKIKKVKFKIYCCVIPCWNLFFFFNLNSLIRGWLWKKKSIFQLWLSDAELWSEIRLSFKFFKYFQGHFKLVKLKKFFEFADKKVRV